MRLSEAVGFELFENLDENSMRIRHYECLTISHLLQELPNSGHDAATVRASVPGEWNKLYVDDSVYYGIWDLFKESLINECDIDKISSIQKRIKLLDFLREQRLKFQACTLNGEDPFLGSAHIEEYYFTRIFYANSTLCKYSKVTNKELEFYLNNFVGPLHVGYEFIRSGKTELADDNIMNTEYNCSLSFRELLKKQELSHVLDSSFQ